MARIGGQLLGAFLLSAVAMGSAAAQSWAYANVVGSTSNGAAMIASDTGGVEVGLNGARPMLASAPGRTFTPPKQMERPTKEEYGLQNLYSQVNETSLASVRNTKLFKQISEVYIAQQAKDPNLIIDVLTVPARGKNGVEKSKRVALAVAQQLRDNGVKNVRLDFNPDFPPTKQTRPAPKST
ncbi:hypothetical protein IP84_13745 [beta proteobacterium AAP99]|nr:hypothetical protein IP84_13745 [beta proteobacterium AAP99]